MLMHESPSDINIDPFYQLQFTRYNPHANPNNGAGTKVHLALWIGEYPNIRRRVATDH